MKALLELSELIPSQRELWDQFGCDEATVSGLQTAGKASVAIDDVLVATAGNG
jgi:hypothetical protein